MLFYGHNELLVLARHGGGGGGGGVLLGIFDGGVRSLQNRRYFLAFFR